MCPPHVWKWVYGKPGGWRLWCEKCYKWAGHLDDGDIPLWGRWFRWLTASGNPLTPLCWVLPT